MTRFERKVAGYDRDEANRRREGRLADHMEGEQAQLDRQAAARMSARERRLAENAMIAKSDPGRFSPFERNALLGLQHTKAGDVPLQDRQERQGLQDFEMAKLKQQGANEVAVAEQKRLGMKEQGSDAAGIAAKSELAKAEEEWGARKSIAYTDAETKRYGFDKDLEGKKYGADATVDAETERQKGALAVAKQQGTTAETVAGIQQSGAIGVATQQARIAAAQQTHREERQDAKLREELIQKNMAMLAKNERYRNSTPEQLRAEAEKMTNVGQLDRFRK